jgi:hypothetical protein
VAPAAARWIKGLKGMDDRGEFGVYCLGCSVVVVTARFMPTE